MQNIMAMSDKQLGGWSLLLGAVVVAAGFILSPGRGAVDSVSFVTLNDVTLAMGRNETLAYTTPVVIVIGGLLVLHGLMTLRRYAAPLARLGLLAMALALVLQMMMRGLDYMMVGMGAAAIESDAAKSKEWLDAALAMQRVWFSLHLTSVVAGFTGTAIMALGLAFRPGPVRLPPALNAVAAALAVASLAVFLTTWHSDELEMAFAPVFAAISLSGFVYVGLLGRGLATSKDDDEGRTEAA